jgi:hypothetical protein
MDELDITGAAGAGVAVGPPEPTKPPLGEDKEAALRRSAVEPEICDEAER